MIILLHSSKTMKLVPAEKPLAAPELIQKTNKLANYIKTLTSAQLAKVMKLSPALAQKTHQIYADWTDQTKLQSPALDSFIGDIYSGLQAPTFNDDDRQFANQHLRILSGLYGIIRPLDGIYPYRLEMGYKFPDHPFASLYDFWKDDIAKTLPEKTVIINLSSDEFSSVITPFVEKSSLIAPKFLTINAKTGQPAFVTIHAKIARGNFAHWMIKNRISESSDLHKFNDLNYQFDPKLSTKECPVFVCQEFGGKGLSMKTSK